MGLNDVSSISMLLLAVAAASFDVDNSSPNNCGVNFVSVSVSSGTWCSSIDRSNGDVGRELENKFEPLGIGESMVLFDFRIYALLRFVFVFAIRANFDAEKVLAKMSV